MDLANAQEARSRPFDAAHEAQQKEAILKLFVEGVPRSGAAKSADAPAPIFVLGLPRSGTTLVEQIVTAHKGVTGFGELASAGRLAAEVIDKGAVFDPDAFAALYRQALPKLENNSTMFVDKMPANYRYIGFLAEAFPDARFICLKRDPRDVALSMWRSYFPNHGMDFTFDLGAIAHVMNDFVAYMNHWHKLFPDRVLQIKYEDIVSDIDTASRDLAQFCGLEWDAAMAHPEQNTSAVRTASLTQVRQVVHTRSVGGWTRLKTQLAPFTQALDKSYWPDLD